MANQRENVHKNFGGECFPEDISPYVLLPTTANQVEMIASKWDQSRRVTEHYEFLIYTGEYQGIPMTACSTGLGGVSTATAVEELASLGARTLIQIGFANPAINPSQPEELTIATGAVRYDGTSHDYVRPEYPAVAHFEVVMALISAAEKADQPYRVGVVASFASSGLERSQKFNTGFQVMKNEIESAGIFGGSGEEATILIQGSLYGIRAGSIISSQPSEPDDSLEENLLKTGIEAMRILAAWDERKSEENLSHIVPG